MIKADRKITSLKQLQGHIWRTGFEREELQRIVFEDVPEALKNWHANGRKVYIYSSGSREAQRLLFGNTCDSSCVGILIQQLETKEKRGVILISLDHLGWTVRLKSCSSQISSKKPLLQKVQVLR
uniref:MTBC n=1 Tax=Arundo donax TaxID=35708 RepID=A0A0A9F940_ARUDO